MPSPERYYKMTDNEQILFNSLSEIALKLNDDNRNPVSLSLFLWEMGFDDPDAKDKLFKAAMAVVLNSDNPLELRRQDFYREFAKVSDEFTDPDKDKILIQYILRWFGLNYTPILYTLADNMLKD
ncbi:hypothetical protein PUF88_06670 [Lactobacillaceae bacterium L1_55_11]|nr:hypothetical protein [Lactobacillaceae bacterium L1_55_11]